MTACRVVFFGAPKLSLMILKTRLNAGRVNTAITMPSSPSARAKRASGSLQVGHQVAEQLGLAVLVVADGVVELVHPLERHDGAEELDQLARARARPPGSTIQLKPKTMLTSFWCEQHRIHHDAPLGPEQGKHERQHQRRRAGSGRPRTRPCCGRIPARTTSSSIGPRSGWPSSASAIEPGDERRRRGRARRTAPTTGSARGCRRTTAASTAPPGRVSRAAPRRGRRRRGTGSRYSIAASTPTVLNTRRVTELKKVCASSASGRSRRPAAWRARMAAQSVRSMTASCRMSCTSATAASTCVR